jgi:hypothetical protein
MNPIGMQELFKKLHAWLGLLSFTVLLVYGITGLSVTLLPAPEARPQREAVTEFVHFRVPPNLTDKQVADRVWEALKLPLTNPAPEWSLRRDAENNLTMGFYTPNGPTRVTVLEREGQLRLVRERAAWPAFLNNLHASTLRDLPVDWRMRAWVAYNEFALFALIFMSLSGVYLWLSSRPRHRLAQLGFFAGTGSFLALYWLSR